MDTNLKLKALSHLVKSQTPKANEAIVLEFDNAVNLLKTADSYEVIEYQLKIINVLTHKLPNQALDTLVEFSSSIENRKISYGEIDPQLINQFSQYYNQETLLIKALEIIEDFRYFDTKAVFNLFLRLTIHESKTLRSYVSTALDRMSKYNISVISKFETGFQTQQIILSEIIKLDQTSTLKFLEPVLSILSNLLSTEMEDTSWESYNTLTFSRGVLPANTDLASIRNQSLDYLKWIYSQTSETSDKLKVLQSINNAARSFGISGNNENLKLIVIGNSISVINFYLTLTQTEALPIIQRIEHSGYWLYYHALSNEVEIQALKLEASISAHEEYQIYKVLIGYEGIFEDWKELKSDSFQAEKSDQVRTEKIAEYIKNITLDNFPTWKNRILLYSLVKSNDLATFPKFYEFLALFGKSHPKLALNLLIEEHSKISLFIIPIVRSIWLGPEKLAMRKYMEEWIANGLYLSQLAKVFLDNPDLDFILLNSILDAASTHEDFHTLSILPSVAVSNYESNSIANEQLIVLFERVVTLCSQFKLSDWVFDIWYRKQLSILIPAFTDNQIDLIITNLLSLKEINYHAEEILNLIAIYRPTKVIDFLCARLESEASESDFEAIPFELFKLDKPLSTHPNYLLEAVFKLYRNDSYLFQFKGARLGRVVFKEIQSSSEQAMLRFIEISIDHLLCVALILRNYEGQMFLYPIVKAMINLLPLRSEYWSELEMILESTGVVSGEFGFVHAYINKKEQVLPWLVDENEKVVAFAEWYIAILEENINREEKRAEEQLILRKHQFN